MPFIQGTVRNMTSRIQLLVLFGMLPLLSIGSDTLRLSIAQADSIFLSNNYQLLAAAMNMRAQDAQVIQAKLYPNPLFTAAFNVYDPDNQQALHVGASGQKYFQIEQLILIGGKRKAEIELAKTNSVIASLEFENLVRTLKYQLHGSMYALKQQLFLLQKYDAQLNLLDEILTAYDEQSKNGNIPMKDVIRLKGVYLNLNNDRAELFQYYLKELAQVQSILQVEQVVVPIITDDDLEQMIKLVAREELQHTALVNRPDYLISQKDKLAAEQYYHLQKKLAIPDLNAFVNYDQRSGAFNNEINAGISIPLPVWNRNKGNIRSAQHLLEQRQYSQEGLKLEIYSTIRNQLDLYNQTVFEYRKAQNLYNEDFEITLKGMSDNFLKQNISVLEFVDFFEAYNNSLAEIARIKIQLAESAELLNLTIGKEVF
jgi:cobalt-zinc-cadmium efflux system outer membrane protein